MVGVLEASLSCSKSAKLVEQTKNKVRNTEKKYERLCKDFEIERMPSFLKNMFQQKQPLYHSYPISVFTHKNIES